MFPGTWAQRTPDKPALVIAETGRTTTYAELDERSLRLAHVLADAGLATGDVVALVSDNAPEAYEVYWAALRSGLYVTAVNHHLSASEAAYIVNDCGAKAMVVSAAKAELIEAMADQIDVPVRLAFGGDVAGCTSYAEALAGASTEPLADQPHGDDFLYSSGTTGRPKGIKLPLLPIQVDEQGYPYVMIFGALFGYGPDTVYLSPAPVYHAAPLRYTGVIQALGGTVVLMERFDAEGFLECRAGLPRHRHPGGADDVRADAQAARGGAGVVRHLEPEDRRPRRGAVPGRGEAADDGVARADRARVLREHRGQRRDVRRTRGLAGAPGHGRQAAARHPAHLRPGGQGAAGGRGRDDLLRARPGAVHLPRRRGQDGVHAAPRAPVVVHGRRPRLPRRRGLPVPDRPQGVHDHQRRREHLPAGDRGPVQPAPGGARHRRDRRTRRRDGGAGGGVRRSLPVRWRSRRAARRADVVRPGADRALQGPARVHRHRRPAAYADRQAGQAEAARPLCRGSHAHERPRGTAGRRRARG